jgi:hypothetical protein
MKIYLWSRVDALKEHYPGMAFAHSDSKESAIALIVGKFNDEFYGNEQRRRLREELESKEPEVIEGTYGHVERGSM